MLPFLDSTSEFPDVNKALVEPNGLLAAGADLSPQRLINAYSKGIFPWFSDDEPILWWSPDPRIIFETQHYQPSRSLIRFLNKTDVRVTLNHAFTAVIQQCAAPRENQSGTWITKEIINAYEELHRLGFAHSVEVWQGDDLVGGIYGVAIGRLFCGESMFSNLTNGSKIGLSALIGYLKLNEFPILDCQVNNNHLVSLGAKEIARMDYVQRVKDLVCLPTTKQIWEPQELEFNKLILRHPKSRTGASRKNGV